MKIRIIIGVIFMALCTCAFGNHKTLTLQANDFAAMNLTRYTSLFVDKTGDMTFSEIRMADDQFIADWDTILPYEYPTAHWLKLKIIANVDMPERWLIFKNPHPAYQNFGNKDYVDAYFISGDKKTGHYKSGALVPRKEKSVKEKSLVNIIPLRLLKNDSLTIYLRVQDVTLPYSNYIELELRHPIPGVSNLPNNTLSIYGGFGAYLAVGLYVLFFFFATRERSYLYFGLFALLYSTHYLFIHPHVIDDLFYNFPKILYFTLPLISCSIIFLFLFGRSFTQLKSRFPGWDKYLLVVIALIVFLTLMNFYNNLEAPYSRFRQIIAASFLLLVPLCIRLVLTKHFPSRLFAIGVFWFLLWNTIGLLWNFDIISLPFNPWPVGQIGLLLIYGVGLGYDFMMGAKIKAQTQHMIELDKMKSKFFANISHEFRTPLSLILGPINQAQENIPASEPLEDTDEVPIKAKYLKVVKRNALRLQDLVDQLLDLSKLDSGKMTLKVSEGKIISFIRAIVFSFESLAERKHINFNTSFPPEINNAFFDQDSLEKILVNLLSNAFKFTPEHGTIKIHVEKSERDIKIQVSDSGKGVTANEVSQIFNRFYQSEGTEEKGTGIGLALVKELVELYNGQISVDSILGEETTFKLSLPYKRSDFKEDQLISIQEMTSPSTPLDVLLGSIDENESNQHVEEQPLILIAEDNQDLRNYIHESLKKDYNIITTKDGREALDMAVEKIPDLVISDVMMPKMDGFELCQALKTNDKTSHIPLILLTAKAGKTHKIEGLVYGADDYLTKPFDLRELKARIENLIQQRQTLREKYHSELRIKPSGVNLNSVDERFIKQVMEEIEKNIANEYYTVEDLATAVNFSRSQLNRKIKALTNKTSNHLIKDFRMARAKEMLEQNAASVSEIAYLVGYSNLSYFTKSFKKAFGILPSELKIRNL